MTSPVPLDVGGARLEAHDVGLLKRKLGSVFDCQHALAMTDIARKRIEERSLAGTRAAGDDHVKGGWPQRSQGDAPSRG